MKKNSKLEARSQKPEVRSWKAEGGSWKLEARSQKPEAGRRKAEAGSWKLEGGSQKAEVRSQTSDLRPLASERGIALVITLILLSVTLVMAIAFLAISRRERDSVTTTTDTATAKLAADSALAHAEAQIVANVFATTNPYSFGLLVSTNFINTNGFATGIMNPTNVNYAYPNGDPLDTADSFQNLASLLYSPRAPVFVVTNSQSGATDFRFYLDLNQNGMFEPTGVMPATNNAGKEILDVNNNPVMVNNIGDPQWIGQLARPDAPHGPNNYFVARYAFVAVPAGNALDLNYIHNQVFDEPPTPSPSSTILINPGANTSDGFLRNQGVGSWEINLAAFLADLNTDEWLPTIPPPNNTYYAYYQPSSANSGHAFDDARALLAYRYANNYNSLVTVGNYFTNLPNYPYNLDVYSDGPLQTTIDANEVSDNTNLPWAGSDNTNHYFYLPSDLFDRNKTVTGVPAAQVAAGNDFSDRLLDAGTNTFGGNTVSTYDRYTFYRLLSQLGTDSPAESGKINLNYVNVDANGNIVPNMETNLFTWTPVQFFTNAADRMLRTYTTNWFQENPTNFLAAYYGITNYYGNINYYYVNPDNSVLTNDPTGLGLTNIPLFGMTNQVPAFGITNIPVFVNSNFVYSSAINRLLQLAANIYDASTNSLYPSVFRPLFSKDTAGNVFITSYTNVVSVTGISDLQLSPPFDVATIAALSGVITNVPDNIFGVPWIIGAKKGFPNFNQFAMQSIFEITRKLQLTRSSTNAPLNTYKVNQQFTFGSGASSGVANQLEVECWNSYNTNYTPSTDIYVTDWLTMYLTNDDRGFFTFTNITLTGFTNVPASQWPGYTSGYTTSFLIPLNTNTALVPPNSVYVFNSGSLPYITNAQSQYETNVSVNGSSYPEPHWWLIVTNNIQVAMVDHVTERLIDYVQLRGPNSTRDLNNEILGFTNFYALWQTGYVSSSLLGGESMPFGVAAQLLDSQTVRGGWATNDAGGFNNFINYGANNGQAYGTTNLQFQAYSPPATTVQLTFWEANDPLVHYIASDLFDSENQNHIGPQTNSINPLIATFPNERYQPWGRSSQMANTTAPDTSPFNLALKDPLIWTSDHWDFPTNKFPTVGWLGRVHRGTPWQTVYLKATNILATSGINTWTNWTGNLNVFDAINAAPVQDQLLFDVFSTAPDDNATHGQLSVNVAVNPNDPAAGLAAWSALFSGIIALNNNTNGLYLTTYHTFHPLQTIPSFTAFPVNPAGVNGTNSFLGQLVVGINTTRANTNLFSQQFFAHAGNILSTPQLTVQSPFLNWNNVTQQEYGISDEMYEWLPQQAMSLLNCPTAPRYVVYCYGQTLKPAQNSLVTGGSFFGMCTNYQVVSEAVVRAVIRVDDANTSHPRAVVESYNVLPPD